MDGISLTIPKGEFFAVLGPNAAGKTTTIKMLTGLIKPNSGHALIGGFDVQERPLDARRRLAYVPDFSVPLRETHPVGIPSLSRVRCFRCRMTRSNRVTQRELIPRFSLDEFVKKSIEGLSHGTRQRVAIVAALLHDPEVFVIDEPMVGLDPHHARVVKDVLKERSQNGMTVFLSTHQLSVAEELADRIGIITAAN